MERRVIGANGERLEGTERNRVEWTGWHGQGRDDMERDGMAWRGTGTAWRGMGRDGKGLGGTGRKGT